MKPFLIVSSLMALVVGAGVYFTAPCSSCCEAPVEAAPAAAAVVEAAPAAISAQPVATSSQEAEAPSSCSPCFPDQAVDLEQMISAEAQDDCAEASECASSAKKSCPSETQPIALEAQAPKSAEECGTEECPPADCCAEKKQTTAQN